MKIDITDTHFVELHKKGYTVDMVLLLSWVNKGLSIEHIVEGSKKIEVIYKSMIRKGLLSEDDKLTQVGIEILDFISKKTNKKFVKPKVFATEFDEWWDVFPKTDIFEHRGRKFEGTRSLRANKEKCRLTFNKLILENKYTKDEIINATLYDINMRKNNSIKKGTNQLTFIQNSATYLYQESFEPFIEFGKPKQESNRKIGSVDI